MVAAFPIVKLAALAFRQVAKPIANSFKTRAKSSPFFRHYVCMPPAQLYHWLEVNVKMKLLGLGKPNLVQKLNETAAIELGAELLGETIIFLAAAATLTAEYVRQTRNSNAQAIVLEERWTSAEKRLEELEFLVDKQRAEITELTRLVYKSDSKKQSPPANGTGDGKPKTGLFGRPVV
ncbi:optic atrophy 3 protein homolog [Oppia nitens]|uniref:optic atrophy 3 protein homolog n=1 Tax=Oppia nitens TaxID=1686743 RepID=UPI0023DB62CB|nr:optic atrophy 3 protein homolog [Oppia nitens]